MTAQVVRLRPEVGSAAATSIPREVLGQLHGLLRLDPIAGASPARTLFAVSGAAKARLVRCLAPADREAALAAPALAVTGFDFLFAVSLLLAASPVANPDCAQAIRTAQRSAAIQGEVLGLAAHAVGLRAEPIANFDAAGLRAAFFAGTQATVVSLCRLAPEASLIAASAFDDLA
jgi:3-hydroxypropanoate dehydrogenase